MKKFYMVILMILTVMNTYMAIAQYRGQSEFMHEHFYEIATTLKIMKKNQDTMFFDVKMMKAHEGLGL